MEVHHHTHHPKKWKEYFWEFFMLFLAVFCGFLAEIQVEHYVESQRAKKYMTDLISDIREDSSWIHTELKRTATQLGGYDSLTILLNRSDYSQQAATAYRLFDQYSVLLTPLLNDQTITQLRSSGNLRLIKNAAIVKQIDQYWTWQQAIRKISDRVEERLGQTRELAIQIFDQWQIDSTTLKKGPDDIISPFLDRKQKFFASSVQFLSRDPLLIKKFCNLRTNASLSARYYRWALMEMEKDGLTLKKMLEDEYGFRQ